MHGLVLGQARRVWLVALLATLAGCGGGSGGQPNRSPTAAAGPDITVFRSESTQLDGSSSTDPDGNSLTYSWVQQSGAPVSLSGASSARPTFTAPSVSGTLVFNLTVSDGQASSADSLTVTIQNRVPTASAGEDLSVNLQTTVTLVGSGSFDPDADALTYTWVQTFGPAVTLTQLPNGDASFVAPMHYGVLEFRLTVSDGELTSNQDTVFVGIGGAQVGVPVADAGWDSVVPRNAPMSLSGWVADPSWSNLTVQWRQVSGIPVTLANADTLYATFTTPNEATTLEFELTARNAFLTSVPDRVVITVRNYAPYITMSIAPLAPRTLDDLIASVQVSDWDQDAHTVDYVWRRNGAVVSGLTSTTFPNTQHVKGDVIQLTVTSSDPWEAASASVSVTIEDTPPTFTATPPTQVDYGNTFAFAISASDIDNDPVNTFELKHGPAGMQVTPGGAVSWQAVLSMFGNAMDVNYAVGMAGSDAALTATVRVDDAARALPMRRSGIEIPMRDGALQVVDLDNDGDREVLIAGSRIVYELAWDGAGYTQRWAYPFLVSGDPGTVHAVAADVMGDARMEIFMGGGNNIVRLDGATRNVVSEFALDSGEMCRKIELADLDANGPLEVVCLAAVGYGASALRLVVLDAATMQLLWRSPDFGSVYTGGTISVGNVDADPALEIVTGTGYIFDGATRQSQWVHASGFGSYLDTGDLDGDGVEEIVGGGGSATTNVYRNGSNSPLGSINTGWISAVAVRDIEGTAAAEILVGNEQWGNIAAYSYDVGTSSSTQLFQVNSQGHGVGAIDVGNLDADGRLEFIWGSDTTSSGANVLIVADRNPGIVVEWTNDAPRQLSAFTGGMLATIAPGQQRLMFAAVAENSSPPRTLRLLALDPATGAMTLSSSLGDATLDSPLDVVDYDGDGNDEAFVGRADYFNGALLAYEFAGDTQEWVSPADAGSALAVAHADFTNDGAEELVAVSQGSLGGRVNVFDVLHNNLLWRSPMLSGAADVAVADLDGDAIPEIIAASYDTITVYRRSTSPAFVAAASVSLPSPFTGIDDLLVADTDGDGVPEIYALCGWSPMVVRRYTPNLTLVSSFGVGNDVASIHLENLPTGRRNLIVSRGYAWSQALNPPRLLALDPRTGAEIWRSPVLDYLVTRGNLFYVDPDADGRPQISFAAGQSAYLTQ